MPYMPSSAVDEEQWWRNDKQAVLSILRRHVGKNNAICSKEIAQILFLSEREVRAIIAELVKDGELIGASVDGRGGGYYLIENERDLEETRAILRSRAAKIFERDRDLCRAWERKFGKPLQPLLPQMEEV